MSKSKGNVLYADDLASVFGVDPVRYYLLASMPFDNDGLVSWEMMTEKINAELANVYGNLVKRTISMTNKYFDGVVERSGVTDPIDDELKDMATTTYQKVATAMDEFKIADAIGHVFSLLRRANKYIDETAPWVLAKSPEGMPRLKEVMYNLTETITICASILAPFMPETSAEVLSELNVQARSFDMMDNFGLYPSGNKVTADPKVVFARQDIAEVLKQAEEIAKKYEKVQEAPAKESKQEPLPEQIGIEDFAKVALRVALVTACEKVEKSDKLLKLTLSLGNEQRTVASGIAEYYKPEEVVGKKVILVANLKPAKLRGILSEGMILCAEKDGKVTLVEPNADMPEGSVVR